MNVFDLGFMIEESLECEWRIDFSSQFVYCLIMIIEEVKMKKGD